MAWRSSQLTREQKEAVGILSVGTFLEYFDLMLYVHMAVKLNDLFFPAENVLSAKLASAFAFCSTYLLRPFGSLIFGYIGDHLGRKPVIIITSMLMAFCCLTMAALPTYASIGISASVAVTVCRMMQGMAAGAECTGAELYITENFAIPRRYFLTAMLAVITCLGTTVALGVASVFVSFSDLPGVLGENSWRVPFVLGAIVGVVGSVARSALKEAGEFSQRMGAIEKKLKNKASAPLETHVSVFVENWKGYLAYFLMQCGRAPCLYFIYVYCSDIMKHSMGLSPERVITHNFFVSIFDMCGVYVLAYLSSRIYPMKILVGKLVLFFCSMAFYPFFLSKFPNSTTIFIFQCLACFFAFDHVPASPILYKFFPVSRRFTHSSLVSAAAKIFTGSVMAVCFAYCDEYISGNYGPLAVIMPFGLASAFAIRYFWYRKEVKFEAIAMEGALQKLNNS